MLCIGCNKETNNPKYCSRSCSATVNNKLFKKRNVEGKCKGCGEPLTATRSYCKICYNDSSKYVNTKRDWSITTVAQLRGEGNANFGGRYPIIRHLSRKWYLASDKPKSCVVCGYSLHFDVCHIKDVKEFDPQTTIDIVNSLDNLIALCKNHHWEFDNNHLELDSI